MNIKKHIPNAITCGNLLCGCIGIVGTLKLYAPEIGAVMIFAAAILDFFDGFVARLLKVSSPIGKELDSLADVVSFGVLPGIIAFELMSTISLNGLNRYGLDYYYAYLDTEFIFRDYFKYTAIMIPVFSALRLAKFNIDTRQSDSFIGVPTPANAILFASIPLILIQVTRYLNPEEYAKFLFNLPYVIAPLTIIMSLLLVAEIPLFALKFKNFTWADNKIRFIFLGISAVLIPFLLFTAIPIIVFLYITLSVVNNLTSKKKQA